MRTLCFAYHKEFEIHQHSILDISDVVADLGEGSPLPPLPSLAQGLDLPLKRAKRLSRYPSMGSLMLGVAAHWGFILGCRLGNFFFKPCNTRQLGNLFMEEKCFIVYLTRI